MQSLNASITLARTRVDQNTKLVAAGGNRFDLEQSQTTLNESTRSSRRRERPNRKSAKNSAAALAATWPPSRRRAQIATTEAQVKVLAGAGRDDARDLETAKFNLAQTTLYAPGNGTMVNVMLRPGFFVAACRSTR